MAEAKKKKRQKKKKQQGADAADVDLSSRADVIVAVCRFVAAAGAEECPALQREARRLLCGDAACLDDMRRALALAHDGG